MKRLYADPVSEIDQFAATIVKYIESCARGARYDEIPTDID